MSDPENEITKLLDADVEISEEQIQKALNLNHDDNTKGTKKNNNKKSSKNKHLNPDDLLPVNQLVKNCYPLCLNDQNLLNHIKNRNIARIQHARSIFTEHERSIFHTIRKELKDSNEGAIIRANIEKNRLFAENDYKNSLNEYHNEFIKANKFEAPECLKNFNASTTGKLNAGTGSKSGNVTARSNQASKISLKSGTNNRSGKKLTKSLLPETPRPDADLNSTFNISGPGFSCLSPHVAERELPKSLKPVSKISKIAV